MSKDTNTTAVATEAPKKSAGKLPENFLYYNAAGEILTKPIEGEGNIIDSFVKMFSVKKVKDKEPRDIVKHILLLNLRSQPEQAELPEGYEFAAQLTDKKEQELNDVLFHYATQHVKAKEEQKEKENTAKQAKAEEREAAKKAKEEEDKVYQAEQDEFEVLLVANAKKQSKNLEKLAPGLVGQLKFSDKITISGGNMGISVADGATKQDIAGAIAQVLTVFEGTKQAEGAMQFMIGDLLNASVKTKVFRTQNEAATGLKHIIADKMGKNFQVGTLPQYAVMASRIPASQRKLGVNPSYYLAASKVTTPRLKDSQPADAAKAEAEVAEFREELIADINSGTVALKDIAKKVQEYKEERGWAKPKDSNQAEVAKALKDIFWIDWMISNLAKDDAVVVARGKESQEYTLAELSDMREAAVNIVEAEFLKEYDIKGLKRGSKPVTKNGKTTDAVYRLSDPLFVKVKEDKDAEPEQAPVEEVEAEEEEEEEETEEGDGLE
jgi:hypothetical protein